MDEIKVGTSLLAQPSLAPSAPVPSPLVPSAPALSPVVVIGDLVASRRAPDRRALHRVLEKTLVDVNARVRSIVPLDITVGDEFQGVYASMGAALDAAFRVRVDLLPEVDTRFGIARGSSTVLDTVRGIQDGPAWWSAREAIEAVEDLSGRGVLRSLRTAYRVADGEPAEECAIVPAVNAAIVCRDHLVGSLSPRSVRLLRGLMDEHTTQAELAAGEGISASAVSQRIRADGLGVLLAAQAELSALS